MRCSVIVEGKQPRGERQDTCFASAGEGTNRTQAGSYGLSETCVQGIHLIRHAVYRTVEQNGQFVLLGSGHADGDFRAMAEGDFKGHPHVRLMIMYSESLAHLIYAAADIICVPSLYEPCG